MSDFKIGEIYGYNSQEVNRNNNNNNFFNPSINVEREDESIWQAQKVAPVSFTSTPAMQAGGAYVSNPNLFETLNAMGTGEHSPKEYDEFTGKRLDFNA